MRTVAVLPPVKNELHAVLLNLAAFKNYTTEDLIAMARTLPGGTKVQIPDRVTAIALLLGTRAASPRPPDRPDPPALPSTTEEAIVTIGLKPGNANTARHLDTFKNLSSSRIDSPQITVITFRGRVPELTTPGGGGDSRLAWAEGTLWGLTHVPSLHTLNRKV